MTFIYDTYIAWYNWLYGIKEPEAKLALSGEPIVEHINIANLETIQEDQGIVETQPEQEVYWSYKKKNRSRRV